MRMNERGLGTGALVGIIVGVIVAIVVPVTVVVLGVGGGSPGGLPVYSGASYLTSSSQGSTTECTYDLGTANLASVYSWYKTEMPNKGWTLTGDEQMSGGYFLQYTKGNGSAVITIGENMEGSSATRSLNLSYTAGTPS